MGGDESKLSEVMVMSRRIDSSVGGDESGRRQQRARPFAIASSMGVGMNRVERDSLSIFQDCFLHGRGDESSRLSFSTARCVIFPYDRVGMNR